MAKHDQPIISIIVPLFNKAKYLDTVLKSISKQSFKEFECLLIDDGSTDMSPNICKKCCENDKRFVYYHTDNHGVSHARNIGLKNCTGKYITFIDADDFINESYLEELYKTAYNSDLDMTISSLIGTNEQGIETKYIKYPFEETCFRLVDILPLFSKLQENYGVLGYCWGKLIKREVIIGYYFDEDIKLAEDLDFYIRVYPNVTTVSYCKNAIYYYRQQAENSSVMIDDKDIDYLTQLKISLRVKQFFKEMKVYYGDNQQYIDQKIQNYIYFWLFYSTPKNFDTRYLEVQNHIVSNHLSYIGCRGFKKVLLKNVYSDNKETVRVLLLLYGFLKRIFR